MLKSSNKSVRATFITAVIGVTLSLSLGALASPKAAPTKDEAFAKLPAGTTEDLLKPENKEKLVAILTYHVVPGRDLASRVTKMSLAKTVNSQSLAISVNGDTVMVDNAKVIKTDILCSNGVIHVIDSVVLPK